MWPAVRVAPLRLSIPSPTDRVALPWGDSYSAAGVLNTVRVIHQQSTGARRYRSAPWSTPGLRLPPSHTLTTRTITARTAASANTRHGCRDRSCGRTLGTLPRPGFANYRRDDTA